MYCFFSADKPKIYQGVRVKTTVKELLQKHRALQAQKTAQPTTVNNTVGNTIKIITPLTCGSQSKVKRGQYKTKFKAPRPHRPA